MDRLTINIISLFPDFFTTPLRSSLLGKAVEKEIVKINLIQLRDFAVNRHGQVDDSPYGGGSGMVMRIEPLVAALRSISEPTWKIALTPRGELYNQQHCTNLLRRVGGGGAQAEVESITLLCGHYEGFDERITGYVDQSFCVGDYVLSGGEVAALTVIDTLARHIPGFMGNSASLEQESFKHSEYIEYPQYTRPPEFEGKKVPDLLLSGNHDLIEKWREAEGKKAFNMFRGSTTDYGQIEN